MSQPTLEIIEMPQPIGIFAGELYQRAYEYWNAFQKLIDDEKSHLHASYFLLAHSLELFLKSYLAARGISKQELRSHRLRHDLAKIHDRCAALNIPMVRDLRPFCRSVQEMNKDNDFRYPSGFNLHVPSPRMCREVMEELQQKIGPIISFVHDDAQLEFISGTRHLKGRRIRWSD